MIKTYSKLGLEWSDLSPNRSIYEGIIVAHEEVHSMRPSKTKKMKIKLDIREAYDHVNKDFLIMVLKLVFLLVSGSGSFFWWLSTISWIVWLFKGQPPSFGFF